jgi:hypothetical protein
MRLASRSALGIAVTSAFAALPAFAAGPNFCSATAAAELSACKHEAAADAANAKALCTNVADADDRDECNDDAKEDQKEALALCAEQRDARGDVCDALGEDRYDPDFDPRDFIDDFAHPRSPNPYFPLRIGNRWKYAGGDERTEVKVLDETKHIEGVTCVVVSDRVEADGDVVEDTDDWFALGEDSQVSYCGELSKSFELFEGDDPEEPELVDLEGSWKTGRDGAKPGTIFLAQPQPGAVYRQEFAPGIAEDVALVLSVNYAFGKDRKLDAHVPAALARLLCSAGDCVVTGEFNALEPDAFERKYYARGIGLFLEVDPKSGDVVRLVECNMDARCRRLP